MLVYEHERTEKIVERLRWAAGIVPYVTIPIAVAFIGLAGLIAGTFILNESRYGAPIGLCFGVPIGIIAGAYSVAIIRVVIEWLAQMLIAQGALLDRLSRTPKD